MVIDKTKFLADQKWKADLLIRESKAEGKGLQIAAQNNLNQRGESAPYRIWDKTNPEHPDYVDPNKIPGEIKQLPIPGLPPELVHHKFTEPSNDELIEGMLNGDVPRGTLGDEETENRLIEERQNQLQQQSLMIKNNVANLPYQDGRAPTRLFYNAPYAKPDVFIKDKQIIEDAKKRFKWNTGINLARR